MLGIVRLANRLLKVYFATPRVFRWVFWLLPLIYFLWPADMLPDFLGGLGRVDDVLLMVFAIWILERSRFFEEFFKHAGMARGKTGTDGPEMASPFETLHVDQDVAFDELKKAYRSQLRRFHPDKFAHLGTKYEEEAKQKTQAIIDAYSRICGLKGWRK